MDAITLTQLVLLCAPLVHPDTAHALVTVESSLNPHAIGVVGGALDRQPRHLAEALATTKSLSAQGWNYSAGLAQINVRNFERLGMTDRIAFDPCQNLRAMQVVLSECLVRVPGPMAPQVALRMALSCYYSGNFVTGFEHGYVQRVSAAAASRNGQPSTRR
jgi:type IV secretion system protein VirB1